MPDATASPVHQVLLNGSVLTIEHGTNGHFWTQIEKGFWEPEMFQLLDHLSRPGTLFVDVGTWIGPLTLYMAQWHEVTGFECDPVALKELKKNIALNPPLGTRVKINPFALADADGTVKLHAFNLGDSASTIFTDIERGGQIADLRQSFEAPAKDALPVFRREGFTQDPAAIVKIDVEGSEFRIIPRIAELIPDSRCVWILSLHEMNLTPENRTTEALRLLDCFAALTWYDMELNLLDSAEVRARIQAGTWEPMQTLVFSSQWLTPVTRGTPRRRMA